MATKPLVTGTRMSVAEFLDLPDTEERNKMELDDGELYIIPQTPTRYTNFCIYWLRLCMYIANYIQSLGTEPPAEVYHLDVVVISVSGPAPRPGALTWPSSLTGQSVPDSRAAILRAFPTSWWKSSLPTATGTSSASGSGLQQTPVFPSTGSSIPINDTALLLELRDGDYVSRGLLTADDTLTTPLLPGLGHSAGRVIPPSPAPIRCLAAGPSTSSRLLHGLLPFSPFSSSSSPAP